MKKILCPTDFSSHAKNAIRFAVRLANLAGCNLHLLHVYQVYRKSDVIRSMDGIIRAERYEEMKSLVNGVIPLMTNDAALESTLIKGDPIQIISNFAESHSYDMILMGTQGSSALKEIFLGSITNGVMNRSSIPVFAIPKDWHFRPIDRIALTLDGGHSLEDTDFECVRELARMFKSEIVLFHVLKEEGITDFIGSLLPYFDGFDVHVETVRAPRVIPAIRQFVRQERPDLLCMIHEKRSFLEELFTTSVTSRELFQSEIPLLILTPNFH